MFTSSSLPEWCIIVKLGHANVPIALWWNGRHPTWTRSWSSGKTCSLHAVVFAMNSSANSSLGYSPYEIIFSQHPLFPLSRPSPDLQLESLPHDLQSYMKVKDKKLQHVWQTVHGNATRAQEKCWAGSMQRQIYGGPKLPTLVPVKVATITLRVATITLRVATITI